MSLYSDNRDIIKNTITLFDFADHYGIELSNNCICCPFHKEKTPSLRLYDDHFHCFGCGEHGDIIKFAKEYLYLADYNTTLRLLNKEFNIGLPFDKKFSLKEIRARQQRASKAINQKTKEERIKAQRIELNLLWADCDRIIIEHPIPDNDDISEAYRIRDYISHLIDTLYNREMSSDRLEKIGIEIDELKRRVKRRQSRHD